METLHFIWIIIHLIWMTENVTFKGSNKILIHVMAIYAKNAHKQTNQLWNWFSTFCSDSLNDILHQKFLFYLENTFYFLDTHQFDFAGWDFYHWSILHVKVKHGTIISILWWQHVKVICDRHINYDMYRFDLLFGWLFACRLMRVSKSSNLNCGSLFYPHFAWCIHLAPKSHNVKNRIFTLEQCMETH